MPAQIRTGSRLPNGLTMKQDRFVQEILVDGNATQAAIRAGYSEDTAGAIGAENLTKPAIVQEIERRRVKVIAKVEQRTVMNASDVLAEWSKIGSLNLFDLAQFDADGKLIVDAKGLPKLDYSKMTRDQFAAVSEIDASSGKLKFMVKDSVLRDMARHFGMFAKDAPLIELNVTLEDLIIGSMGVTAEKKI